VLAAVIGGAIFARDKSTAPQDEYILQVPNGLAFSESRGYEDWQTVAVKSATPGRRDRSVHETNSG
jgi:hypothetical protein